MFAFLSELFELLTRTQEPPSPTVQPHSAKPTSQQQNINFVLSMDHATTTGFSPEPSPQLSLVELPPPNGPNDGNKKRTRSRLRSQEAYEHNEGTQQGDTYINRDRTVNSSNVCKINRVNKTIGWAVVCQRSARPNGALIWGVGGSVVGLAIGAYAMSHWREKKE